MEPDVCPDQSLEDGLLGLRLVLRLENNDRPLLELAEDEINHFFACLVNGSAL